MIRRVEGHDDALAEGRIDPVHGDLEQRLKLLPSDLDYIAVILADPGRNIWTRFVPAGDGGYQIAGWLWHFVHEPARLTELVKLEALEVKFSDLVPAYDGYQESAPVLVQALQTVLDAHGARNEMLTVAERDLLILAITGQVEAKPEPAPIILEPA